MQPGCLCLERFVARMSFAPRHRQARCDPSISLPEPSGGAVDRVDGADVTLLRICQNICGSSLSVVFFQPAAVGKSPGQRASGGVLVSRPHAADFGRCDHRGSLHGNREPSERLLRLTEPLSARVRLRSYVRYRTYSRSTRFSAFARRASPAPPPSLIACLYELFEQPRLIAQASAGATLQCS